MAQDPTIIGENLDGTSFRTAINGALTSIGTCYYGSVDPATVAGIDVEPGTMWWNTGSTDSAEPELWVRDANNAAWYALLTLSGGAASGYGAVADSALKTGLDGKLSKAGGVLNAGASLRMDSGYTPSNDYDVATKVWVTSQSRPPDVRWAVYGTAAVQNKVAQALIGTAATATGLRLWADTAPVGSALSVNLVRLRAGSGDETRSLSISAAQNAASTTFGSPLALLAGDRLRLDITGVGSGTAGGNDLLATVTLTA